jgi:hypothetical protein
MAKRRRFRPILEDFVGDPWELLKVDTHTNWRESFHEQLETLKRRALTSATLTKHTPDQATALKICGTIVMNYVNPLVEWTDDVVDTEPDLDQSVRHLAAVVKQAREFEYQCRMDALDMADFTRYHASSFAAQMIHLKALAHKVRKAQTKGTLECLVTVSLRLRLHTTPTKAESYVKEQGARLLRKNLDKVVETTVRVKPKVKKAKK